MWELAGQEKGTERVRPMSTIPTDPRASHRPDSQRQLTGSLELECH